MSERFKPVETVRSAGYALRLLGAEALSKIDKKLDWVSDDTKEDAALRSRLYAEITEKPAPTEEELNG